MFLDYKTKIVFAKACLGKKLGFHTEICNFRKERILKIGLFRRVKELSNSNQTRSGVSTINLECNTKKRFFLSLPRKKIAFSYGNLRLIRINCDYEFRKKVFFLRVKFFFKLDQIRHRVSHVYLEFKTERVFAKACLGIKLGFQTAICDFRKKKNFKNRST